MDIKQEIPFPLPTENIIIGNNLAQEFCNYLGNYGKCLLVCDENTKDFINHKSEKFIFPANVKPSLESVEKIPAGYDVYAAIGSGTINDMVKYRSYLEGSPYVVFATAASMNGYASGNASLLDEGYKKSFTAAPPKAIFMDIDVISAAPHRLTISGIGDAFCRQLTENDNILANLLRGDKYYHQLFRLMEKYENSIFTDITALCKTLTFGGAAMYAAGSSVPASGAEHMVAHYMELMHPETEFSLHGEQIAVCTVAIARLQERIIHSKNFRLRELDEELVRAHFAATGQAEYFLKESRAKFYGQELVHIDSTKFQIISADAIEEKLESIGAPTKPEQLGWKHDIFEEALKFAAFTRNRVTFLDLES